MLFIFIVTNIIYTTMYHGNTYSNEISSDKYAMYSYLILLYTKTYTHTYDPKIRFISRVRYNIFLYFRKGKRNVGGEF